MGKTAEETEGQRWGKRDEKTERKTGEQQGQLVKETGSEMRRQCLFGH